MATGVFSAKERNTAFAETVMVPEGWLAESCLRFQFTFPANRWRQVCFGERT